MPRDNRRENRIKAKEGANSNGEPLENQDGKEPTGFELDELLADDLGEEEEEIDVNAKVGGENDDDGTDGDDNDEEKKASESEKAVEKSLTPSDVEKKGAEEGKKEDASPPAKTDEAKTEPVKVAPGEKTAEELAAEALAAKQAEPVKPVPTQQELTKQEAPKTLSDQEATQLFSEWRGETEKLLAEHHYRLTEEDVTALNENPAAYIPKAMSRVYLDCISASFQQFVNYLPRMVNQVLEMKEATKKQEDQFFAAWPDLKEHRDTVLRLGVAYRQSNPAASTEDFVNEVGAQSMVALRLVPKSNGHGTHQQQQPPPKEKQAFKPAVGSSGAPPPKKEPTNLFEQLVTEFSDGDGSDEN